MSSNYSSSCSPLFVGLEAVSVCDWLQADLADSGWIGTEDGQSVAVDRDTVARLGQPA